MAKLAVQSGNKFEKTDWMAIKDREGIVVSAPIKPVWGIVATQDCDASRASIISFFQIDALKKVTGLNLPSTPKKWVNLITKKSRLNARWFYLPADEKIGFKERMAINFHVVFQIRRNNLEQYCGALRRGRLNETAFQHYRESIAQYFRRYPYDEWYPLTKEEFSEYDREKGPVKPFSWQE